MILILQVSSLSTELAGEKKVAEELRSQLTLARAEAARHQAQVYYRLSHANQLTAIAFLQVSSRQRSVALGSMAAQGVATGHHTHPSLSSASHPSTGLGGKPATAQSKPIPSTASKLSNKPNPSAASSTQGQKKGQVIDL